MFNKTYLQSEMHLGKISISCIIRYLEIDSFCDPRVTTEQE